MIKSDMEFRSKLGIKGKARLQLFGADGLLKDERIIYNTITELMDAQVADQMSDQGQAAIGYMAVGTGTGQTSASTGLATNLDRNALTSTTQGTAAADNDVVYVATYPAGTGTGTITEAGILNAASDGDLLCYSHFTGIAKAAGDALVINWTLTCGAS